jgi:hypothetical protein
MMDVDFRTLADGDKFEINGFKVELHISKPFRNPVPAFGYRGSTAKGDKSYWVTPAHGKQWSEDAAIDNYGSSRFAILYNEEEVRSATTGENSEVIDCLAPHDGPVGIRAYLMSSSEQGRQRWLMRKRPEQADELRKQWTEFIQRFPRKKRRNKRALAWLKAQRRELKTQRLHAKGDAIDN